MEHLNSNTMKFESGVLVTHREFTKMGIGVVGKHLKVNVRVVWSGGRILNVSPEDLTTVDVSRCETMTHQEYIDRFLKSDGTRYAILGNQLMEYVGIGWMRSRYITAEDLQNYPRVI